MNWLQPDQRNASNPVLATDRVRYVGHPVAVVVADSRYVAEDAADLVVLDIDELPAVVGAEDALQPDAPLLYPAWGTNVVAETVVEAGDIEACFSAAPVRVSGRFRVQRQAAMPMEPRASLADYDSATDEVVLWTSTMTPHLVRTMIATTCGWPEHKLRVVAPDVGGSFGPKDHAYPEDVLVCVLARRFDRPVKWIEDRREHFLATFHAREQVWQAELAADDDGRVLGVRGRILYDSGGHSSNHGIGPARLSAAMMPGPYDIRNYRMEIVAVVTNKVPSGAYRGFGAPQATFVMERLLDRLAGRLGLDRADVRRRNLIPAEACPTRASRSTATTAATTGRRSSGCSSSSTTRASAAGRSRRGRRVVTSASASCPSCWRRDLLRLACSAPGVSPTGTTRPLSFAWTRPAR